MAQKFGTIVYFFLSLFVITSSKNVGEEFSIPNFSDLGEISISGSPISTITAIGLNRQDVGEISPTLATKDELSSLSYEQNVRKEILEDVENLNLYMKMIAEELANDGVVIVQAVKTNNFIEPQNDAVINDDKEESPTSLEVFSTGPKSSPNVNYLHGMKAAKPPMCKKLETKFPKPRKAA